MRAKKFYKNLTSTTSNLMTRNSQNVLASEPDTYIAVGEAAKASLIKGPSNTHIKGFAFTPIGDCVGLIAVYDDQDKFLAIHIDPATSLQSVEAALEEQRLLGHKLNSIRLVHNHYSDNRANLEESDDSDDEMKVSNTRAKSATNDLPRVMKMLEKIYPSNFPIKIAPNSRKQTQTPFQKSDEEGKLIIEQLALGKDAYEPHFKIERPLPVLIDLDGKVTYSNRDGAVFDINSENIFVDDQVFKTLPPLKNFLKIARIIENLAVLGLAEIKDEVEGEWAVRKDLREFDKMRFLPEDDIIGHIAGDSLAQLTDRYLDDCNVSLERSDVANTSRFVLGNLLKSLTPDDITLWKNGLVSKQKEIAEREEASLRNLERKYGRANPVAFFEHLISLSGKTELDPIRQYFMDIAKDPIKNIDPEETQDFIKYLTIFKSRTTGHPLSKKDENSHNRHELFSAGKCYEFGKGVFEKNFPKALELYEAARKLEHSEAATHLGMHYQTGIKVDKDEAKAFKIYYKATYGCEFGEEEEDPELLDDQAAIYLARCYEQGIGTEENPQKAFELYDQITQNSGDLKPASFFIARCYEQGIGTEQNLDKALELHEESFEGENNKSLAFLTKCYSDDKDRDDEKMAELFRSTHYLEDPASTFYLANAYEEGLGVDTDVDYAIRLYRQALYLGHAEAQTRLEECLARKQREEEAELDSESESEAKSDAAESENPPSSFGEKRHADSDEESAPDSDSENKVTPKPEVANPKPEAKRLKMSPPENPGRLS